MAQPGPVFWHRIVLDLGIFGLKVQRSMFTKPGEKRLVNLEKSRR
jgi:hypothetical protein